jgi:hypothetical protein
VNGVKDFCVGRIRKYRSLTQGKSLMRQLKLHPKKEAKHIPCDERIYLRRKAGANFEATFGEFEFVTSGTCESARVKVEITGWV